MTGALGDFAIPWLEDFSWALTVIALAETMAVNTLVTGLIVFKILKVKRTLGSFSSAAGSPNYQHIVFIIIESGMALFAAHLARIVVTILPKVFQSYNLATAIRLEFAFTLIVSFHQMLNVIISSVHFHSFVLLITFTWLGHRTNNNIGASLNGIVLR